MQLPELEWLSVTEYAKLHGVDASAVRHKILRGLLPAHKVGNYWIIYSKTPWIDNRRKKKDLQ